MTSLREWWHHLWEGEQNRSKNMLRQRVKLWKHSLIDSRLSAITTQPPFNDPSWVWGIDIAGVWDGIPDADLFWDAGGRFMIVKAADGTLTGKYLAEIVAALEAAGVPYAFYFWLYPDNCVSTKAQGQAWAALASKYHPRACFVDYEWTSWWGKPANPVESDLLSAVSWMMATWFGVAGVYSSLGYLLDHPLSAKCKFLLWWAAQYGVLYPSAVSPFGLDFIAWQQSDRWAPSKNWGISGSVATDGDVMTPAAYSMLFSGVIPDPDPDPTDTVSHPYEGVTVTSGRRFDTDICMVAVEQAAIVEEHITAPGKAHIVENIAGDIVANGGDFDMTTYQAIGLLRSEGRQYAVQADSEPAIAFDGAGNAWLDHRVESWWRDALGLKRYLVLDGARAPNTSEAWEAYEPRTIYGLRPDGTRLILQCKGRQPDQAGLTLYQAADIMIEFGADRAADGDGGDSVQSRVGGDVFVGTSQRRLVADFYSITITPVENPMAAYDCKVTWKDGASVRPSNDTNNSGVGTLLQGTTFQASELVADRLDPTNVQKQWAKISGGAFDGKYVAVRYPASGVDAWRCTVTPVTPPPAPNTISVVIPMQLTDDQTGERFEGTLTGKLTKVS